MPMLSNESKRKLEMLFERISKIKPITVTGENPQAFGKQEQIFILQKKANDDYYFIPTSIESLTVPPPHGSFSFVILASDPGQVYCAIPNTRNDIPNIRPVDGHASISHWQDVLFAGGLMMNIGKLSYWNNASGHYKPTIERLHLNMLPVVLRLLPEPKFMDINNKNHDPELFRDAPPPPMLPPRAGRR